MSNEAFLQMQQAKPRERVNVLCPHCHHVFQNPERFNFASRLVRIVCQDASCGRFLTARRVNETRFGYQTTIEVDYQESR